MGLSLFRGGTPLHLTLFKVKGVYALRRGEEKKKMKRYWWLIVVLLAFVFGGVIGGAIAINLLCALWLYQNFIKRKA